MDGMLAIETVAPGAGVGLGRPWGAGVRALRAALAALGPLLAAGGCSPRLWPMAPKVRKVRPRVTAIGWSGVDLEFRIDVRNPNYFRLRTPRCRAGFAVEGIEFATADVATRHTLAARRTTTLAVPVHVSYAELWRAYKRVRPIAEATYRLRGTLFFPLWPYDLRVPLAHSGKFPILRMPRFQAASIRFGRVSFRKLQVVVAVDVTNTNAFEVDIRDLGYSLRLGDAAVGALTASTEGKLGPGATGRVALAGEISGLTAATHLALKGFRDLRNVRLVPKGVLKTPYGTVNLDKRARSRE